MVYAPFSLAVARLHCPARLALAHLPPGSAAGQAGTPALQCVSPLACPALRRNCLQDRLARASALRASGSLRRLSFRQFCPSASLKLACSGLIRLRRIRQPALANLATPSGRSQLILLSWRCSPNPPETRKVVGCASFPSFSRSVSTDYRLLT